MATPGRVIVFATMLDFYDVDPDALDSFIPKNILFIRSDVKNVQEGCCTFEVHLDGRHLKLQCDSQGETT